MNALSNRSFSLYFFSNTVSLFGLWMQKIGVGWLTWEITESTFWTSFVTLALMAPAGVLGGLPGPVRAPFLSVPSTPKPRYSF